MNVAVFFGGKSTEHEVSCKSACNIIENIGAHKVIKIGISKKGEWFYTEAKPDEIKNCQWEKKAYNIPVSIDMANKCFIKDGKSLEIDVAFPALHGKNGEDGTIQGLFELLELPYVGSRVVGSALCMDKAYTNIIFQNIGLKHTKWMSVEKYDFFKNPQEIIIKTKTTLKFPVFIKPSNAGSSVAVSKCNTEDELIPAYEAAFLVDSRVIAEEGIKNPLEIEIAVMGNENPIAATAGRVVSATEVYDYNSKYENEKSFNLIPADISEDLSEYIRETAIKAYKACSCAGLARVDFFVDEDKNVYINEINTLPGFTQISMYPQAFVKSGVKYDVLISKLLEYALKYGKI